jgi:hypothetical protein
MLVNIDRWVTYATAAQLVLVAFWVCTATGVGKLHWAGTFLYLELSKPMHLGIGSNCLGANT